MSVALDLHLGDVHLISIASNSNKPSSSSHLTSSCHLSVALVVAQNRNRDGILSGIHLNHLTHALKKLAVACRTMKGLKISLNISVTARNTFYLLIPLILSIRSSSSDRV